VSNHGDVDIDILVTIWDVSNHGDVDIDILVTIWDVSNHHDVDVDIYRHTDVATQVALVSTMCNAHHKLLQTLPKLVQANSTFGNDSAATFLAKRSDCTVG
jgi:hypothetical protein